MKSRTTFIAIGAACVAALAVLLWRTTGQPEPVLQLSPRSDAAGIPGEFLNAQRAAGYYDAEIRKHPASALNYVRLAELYQQEARITGRHHEYIPKALALLDRALDAAPGDFDATVAKASLLMTLHRFDEARTLADRAITRNHHSAFAYGVLCDALVELGEYDAAVKTCDTMLAIRPDIRSYARASYLREIHGNLPGAARAMEAAADAGAFGQENRAWALYNLGMLYLQSGKPDTAEYIFKGILEERADYPYALSGLARLEYFAGKPDSALRLLTRAAEISSDHLFLEQIADIYRSTGMTREAGGTAQIVLRSFEQHASDGWNVDREYAVFCANHGIHLDEALARARREYERRPENVDALDTYAWALFRKGEAGMAQPLAERALALNTQNPDVHIHAALIFRANGNTALACNHLRIAMTAAACANPLCAGEIRGGGSSALASSQ